MQAHEKYEIVSTDQIRINDLILTHGTIFRITEIVVYPHGESIYFDTGHGMRETAGPRRPVFACKTAVVERLSDSIPTHWLPEWIIQGNHLARWSRVLTH